MNETERNYFLSRISQDMGALIQNMLETATTVMSANKKEQAQLDSGEDVVHTEIAPAALTQWAAALSAIQRNLLTVVTAQPPAVDIVTEDAE